MAAQLQSSAGEGWLSFLTRISSWWWYCLPDKVLSYLCSHMSSRVQHHDNGIISQVQHNHDSITCQVQHPDVVTTSRECTVSWWCHHLPSTTSWWFYHNGQVKHYDDDIISQVQTMIMLTPASWWWHHQPVKIAEMMLPSARYSIMMMFSPPMYCSTEPWWWHHQQGTDSIMIVCVHALSPKNQRAFANSVIWFISNFQMKKYTVLHTRHGY